MASKTLAAGYSLPLANPTAGFLDGYAYTEHVKLENPAVADLQGTSDDP